MIFYIKVGSLGRSGPCRYRSIAVGLAGTYALYCMSRPVQGFWPDGIYTAPCDEGLRYDIEAGKAMGLNLLRKHIKVEPDRSHSFPVPPSLSPPPFLLASSIYFTCSSKTIWHSIMTVTTAWREG